MLSTKIRIGYVFDVILLILVILLLAGHAMDGGGGHGLGIIILTILLFAVGILTVIWIPIRLMTKIQHLFGNREKRQDLAVTQANPKRLILGELLIPALLSVLPFWIFYAGYLFFVEQYERGAVEFAQTLATIVFFLCIQFYAFGTVFQLGVRQADPKRKSPSIWLGLMLTILKIIIFGSFVLLILYICIEMDSIILTVIALLLALGFSFSFLTWNFKKCREALFNFE